MIYLSAFFLIAMSLILAICGFLLWKHRNETGDRSRTIQALFSWMSSVVSLMFVFRTFNHTTVLDVEYLAPEHIFLSMIFQMCFFLYPLELLKPKKNPIKIYAFLFAPLLFLFLIGMCAGIEYTQIATHAQLKANFFKPDVLFRVASVVMMLFYGFALYLIPYDYRNSSVDRRFLLTYATGYLVIGIMYFSIQFSHMPLLVLLHQLVWVLFFVGITWYELKVRLFDARKQEDTSGHPEDSHNDLLWEKIQHVLENEGEWRNPDLTLSILASKAFSNRTYIGDAFKRNVGMCFSEYVSKRRIGYVTEQLKADPDSDVKTLFFHAGFRSYSTAWDNFRRVTGMTVSEFVLKQKALQS